MKDRFIPGIPQEEVFNGMSFPAVIGAGRLIPIEARPDMVGRWIQEKGCSLKKTITISFGEEVLFIKHAILTGNDGFAGSLIDVPGLGICVPDAYYPTFMRNFVNKNEMEQS